MLPDMSGLEVCKTLKKAPETRAIPVIMASARGEEIDRVLGFELGADDYVVKPYSMRELLLRIQTILRRGGVSTEPGVVTEFGVLRFDREAHRVWVAGAEVELTALEFKLLVTLFDRKNRVQSRAVLLDDVWGIKADITTRTVDTHVKRLREKLGEAGNYVETVRGVGYRFADSPETAGLDGGTGPVSAAAGSPTGSVPPGSESSGSASPASGGSASGVGASGGGPDMGGHGVGTASAGSSRTSGRGADFADFRVG
jgi:two-component system phosphate regulon response regulator PhoB